MMSQHGMLALYRQPGDFSGSCRTLYVCDFSVGDGGGSGPPVSPPLDPQNRTSYD